MRKEKGLELGIDRKSLCLHLKSKGEIAHHTNNKAQEQVWWEERRREGEFVTRITFSPVCLSSLTGSDKKAGTQKATLNNKLNFFKNSQSITYVVVFTGT